MKILICCTSGLTSRILRKKLESYSKLHELNYEFASTTDHAIEEAVVGCSLLMFAPHIPMSKLEQEDLEKKYKIKVGRFSYEHYAEMNEKAIMKSIEDCLFATPEQTTNTHKISSLLTKFSHNEFLQLMMRSIMAISYFIILGSFLSLLSALPLGDSYQSFLNMTGLDVLLKLPLKIITSVMSLFICCSFGYHFAKEKDLQPLTACILCICAYLFCLPIDAFGDMIKISYFSTNGIALAYLISPLACLFYQRVHCKEKEFSFSTMLHSILPFIILLTIVRYGFSMSPYGSLYQMMYEWIQYPFSFITTDFSGFLLFLLFSNCMWLFGVHGTSIAIMTILPFYSMINTTNAQAYINGVVPTYPIWLFMHWCFIGGAGCTLALNLLMFFSKHLSLREVAKYSITTSIFQIGEPMIFGAPIPFNLFFVIPFLLTPIINAVICYLCIMKYAIVSFPLGIYLENFYPLGLSAWISTGSISGWFLYLALLALDCLIYYPFFLSYDKHVQLSENTF